jgi:endogenous inhibitor of DNA gyrase (YacG/DUF329 family)
MCQEACHLVDLEQFYSIFMIVRRYTIGIHTSLFRACGASLDWKDTAEFCPTCSIQRSLCLFLVVHHQITNRFSLVKNQVITTDKM